MCKSGSILGVAWLIRGCPWLQALAYANATCQTLAANPTDTGRLQPFAVPEEVVRRAGPSAASLARQAESHLQVRSHCLDFLSLCSLPKIRMWVVALIASPACEGF